MALFFECMLSCARKLLDTADIVRDAIFQQLSLEGRGWRCVIRVTDKTSQAQLNWQLVSLHATSCGKPTRVPSTRLFC